MFPLPLDEIWNGNLTCPASLSSQDFKCPVVQMLSHVWLFSTPWTTACQTSLSFTISWSLLKLMSIDLVMPSHPLSSASPPALTLSQHQSLFQWVSSSHQVSKVLELQPQHQSFQGTASPHPQLLFSHLGSPAIASWDLCLLQNCRKKIWEGDRQGLVGVGGPAALASLLAGLSEYSKLLRPGTLESLWRFQQGRGDTCCSFWLLWKHLLWLVFCYL